MPLPRRRGVGRSAPFLPATGRTRYGNERRGRRRKDQYRKLHLPQIKGVLAEGLRLMIFPGYEIDRTTGEAKYGRSYSGRFAELSRPPGLSIAATRRLRPRCNRDFGRYGSAPVPAWRRR